MESTNITSTDKLLGDGSFGCVFQPNIKCNKNTINLLNIKSSKQKVSKIFIDNESVETENKFAKLVYKWDKSGQYFVVPEKICKTKLSNVKKNSKYSECTNLKYVNTEYVSQIVMRHEGIDLKTIFKTITNKPAIVPFDITSLERFPLSKWISLLGNVLEGINILHENGYAHLDIKVDNILYAIDDNKLRLFDFSISTEFENLYTYQKLRIIKDRYFWYPFEFILIYYTKYESNYNELFSEYMNSLYSVGNLYADNFKIYHPTEEIIDKINNMKKFVASNKKWFKILSSHKKKVDLYGLGMVCIYAHNAFDFSTVSIDVLNKYMKFVKSITEIDTRERSTVKQAMLELSKIKTLIS
jgi:serine/threonine protein kinase